MRSRVSFLIAEDDEILGRAVARVLGKHGQTTRVTTVGAAQAALETRRFTAVIVDVGLPDGSGLELLSAARSRDPAVAALVVSGSVDGRRLAEAHRLGASYLLKPVDAQELGLFATRIGAKRRRGDERIAALVDRCARDCELTRAETAVLQLAATGVPRSRLAEVRGVLPSTVKKQVQNVLTKTGNTSLEGAVSRLLRAVVDEDCGDARSRAHATSSTLTRGSSG